MQERDGVHWLQLTYKVPSEPSQKRVWVLEAFAETWARTHCRIRSYLLPYSEEVERHFRQLCQEIQQMGGEASIFAVVALDKSDEQRILQILLEARNREYNTVVTLCSRFLVRASGLVEAQKGAEEGER